MVLRKAAGLECGDCQKVEAVAADYPQLKAMVGFVRRFDASYQDAADKLQQGAVGQPTSVALANLRSER
jgi:myo-inositol 2-dehydrogenase/D-chiro-inositol 1-dehydrogenase